MDPADESPFEDPPESAQPAPAAIEPTRGTPRQMFVMLWATGLGTGYSPIAPGTVGSLLGLPLAVALHQMPVPYRVTSLALLALVGIPICGVAQRIVAAKDPGLIVFDEIVAQAVVLAFVPVEAVALVAGFVWFRLFDIVKPPPLRQLERVPGGAGVMADDLGAAAYASAALLVTLWLQSLVT